jgi:hypothetical protein
VVAGGPRVKQTPLQALLSPASVASLGESIRCDNLTPTVREQARR